MASTPQLSQIKYQELSSMFSNQVHYITNKLSCEFSTRHTWKESSEPRPRCRLSLRCSAFFWKEAFNGPTLGVRNFPLPHNKTIALCVKFREPQSILKTKIKRLLRNFLKQALKEYSLRIHININISFAKFLQKKKKKKNNFR